VSAGIDEEEEEDPSNARSTGEYISELHRILFLDNCGKTIVSHAIL